MSFHSKTIEETLRELNSSKKGISQKEAKDRLRIYGPNTIKTEEESNLILFLKQFHNPLIYILLVAALVSLILKNMLDFYLIIGIVLINGSLGFVQELKAKTSLKSLRKITDLKTTVIREGREITIPMSEVVPGDIVKVREGDVVPADIRLITDRDILIDESILTGESIPVEKDSSVVLDENTPLYERKNILFKGTVVVRGEGIGVVFATGKNTEMGKIVEKTQVKSVPSPFTKAITSFSRKWMVILIISLSILLIIGILQKREISQLFLLVISELVSAVPEGLPLVITLVLVVGALRLAKRKVLVRHLPAVETLGSATYIATDKTGTITEGKLKLFKTYGIVEEQFFNKLIYLSSHPSYKDPVELAIVEWAKGKGFDTNTLTPVKIFPFDIRKRYTASLYKEGERYLLVMKGAFEVLSLMDNDAQRKEKLNEVHDNLAEEGLRVLAIGYAYTESEPEDPGEVHINLAGLVAFRDPPKREAKEAVEWCKKMGIRIIMITGDNLKTAKAIGREVGIYSEGDIAITGTKLKEYDDEELYTILKRTSIVARALPEDKYRIVKVLQSKGEIVAVTGDGINDVPALKVADLGVAMGNGAEAAKDVAKMIITDNNLSVITEAVKYGKIIGINTKKVIYYLLSSSFGEITLLTLAFLLRLPFPLLPTQILWINLITDGVQDKAFPFTKEDPQDMPLKPGKINFFDGLQIFNILTTAIFMGLINLALFIYCLERFTYEHAVTVTFTSMVVNQWINGIHSIRNVPFFISPVKTFMMNPYLFLGLSVGFILQLIVTYLFPSLLHLTPLAFTDWLLVFYSSLFLFLFIELRKWILRYFVIKNRIM